MEGKSFASWFAFEALQSLHALPVLVGDVAA